MSPLPGTTAEFLVPNRKIPDSDFAGVGGYIGGSGVIRSCAGLHGASRPLDSRHSHACVAASRSRPSIKRRNVSSQAGHPCQ
jgi:hypothetical protein